MGFAFENARADADDWRTIHRSSKWAMRCRSGSVAAGFTTPAGLHHLCPVETQARVTVGSGRMEIVGIQGPAELESGSGRLNARDKEDVRATTGSGGVELEDVGGPVNVSAGSGSLTLIRIGGTLSRSAARATSPWIIRAAA